MRVLATAGHVDHGKSTLVRALTGMEPDRWAEERRRGMTIDLGYAWTTLPSGEVLAFVDVPGHARFIGNMLAGLGPAPAVLFVVAADEGWRQQSSEHLAAVRALGLEHVLLAVTRSDLADPGPATVEARQHLGHVPAVAVSGATGAGLDDLSAALDRLVAELPAPDLSAPVRLWVDRVFTVKGAGTVVTGTLAGGVLRVGQQLLLGDRQVRVRALQSLGVDAPEVAAVARVAVNLRGVERDDVARGDVLLAPAAWRATSSLDVRLTTSERLPEQLVLHVGSAAIAARVRPLGDGTARLLLPRPLPLRAGDRALLRDPAAQRICGGVLVLDADPPALRRRGAAAVRARELGTAVGAPDLLQEVTRRQVVAAGDLIALGVVPTPTPGLREVAGWWLTEALWERWVAALPGRVDALLRPLEAGVPLEVARADLGAPDLPVLLTVADAAGLEQRAGRLRRPGTVVSLGSAEAAVRELEERLAADPFDAPEVPDLQRLRLGAKELAAAEGAGRLLRISPELVLLPTAPAVAMRVLAGLGRDFTLSDARKALHTTRRVAVPLLEHLDRRGWTLRVDGQLRRVKR